MFLGWKVCCEVGFYCRRWILIDRSIYNVLADVLYTQHRLTCNTSYLFVKNCTDPPLSTEVVNGHRKCELLDLGKWQLIRIPVRVHSCRTTYQGSHFLLG